MRVLIAEDDPTTRNLLQLLVQRGGDDVVETENGAEAWDALQQPDCPELVLLDWIMPGMDGLDVLRRTRALKAEGPPYIIMLTTRDEKRDVAAALEAGANDYLTKPFYIDELRSCIDAGRRKVLSWSQDRRRFPDANPS